MFKTEVGTIVRGRRDAARPALQGQVNGTKRSRSRRKTTQPALQGRSAADCRGSAESWRSYLCCVSGSATVEDDELTPQRRRVRRGKHDSLSSLATLSPEDVSLTLWGSNLHSFTYVELRAATANFSRANYLCCGWFGPVYRALMSSQSNPINDELKALSTTILVTEHLG